MPHIHEKIDFTVEVFVVHKNKVFLRKHDKYKIWLAVGGHIELDEDPNEAAIREAKEEAGFDVTLYTDARIWKEKTDEERDLIPPRFLNRHRISPTHEHVTMIFFGTVTNDTVTINEGLDDRSDEYGWFSPEELKSLELKEHIRLYAETALTTLAS